MEIECPGENENESDFYKRRQSQKNFIEKYSSLVNDSMLKIDVLDRFDLSNEGIFCFFSKKRIPFWQGAVTVSGPRKLVEKELQKDFPNQTPSEEMEIVSYLQMPPKLKRGKLFGIYSLREIASHELVHIARASFSGSKYEEMLAYQTSSAQWRRIIGPLFEKSWESTLFLGLGLLGFLEKKMFLLGMGYLGFLCFRLIYRHILFHRCKRKLNRFCAIPEKIMAVMVRLTDQEISHFGRISIDAIRQEINKKDSYRWKILRSTYLSISSV